MPQNSFWLGRKVPASPHRAADVKELFSPEECGHIVALGQAAPQIAEDRGYDATVKRTSRMAWIGHDVDKEVSGKVAYTIRQVNEAMWQYDLLSFEESFQFTEYRGDEEGRFDPHQDTFFDDKLRPSVVRKLSMTVLLSRPGEDFEGGDFVISDGLKMAERPMNLGDAIVFPSHLYHGVRPVIAGIRRSLVLWVWGPPLR